MFLFISKAITLNPFPTHCFPVPKMRALLAPGDAGKIVRYCSRTYTIYCGERCSAGDPASRDTCVQLSVVPPCHGMDRTIKQMQATGRGCRESG